MYREGTEKYEYHLKTYGGPAKFGYKDFIPQFTAEKFDPNEWAELFRRSGACYAGPVAEHHDGFAMWDTQYSEWNTLIAPPTHGSWLEEIDFNCFYSDFGEFIARVQTRAESDFEDDWKDVRLKMKKKRYTFAEWRALGFDQHSVFADPMFMDAQGGDYRLKPESPALKLGFMNFDARLTSLKSDYHNPWKD